MQENINISAVIHSKEAVALSEDQKKQNITSNRLVLKIKSISLFLRNDINLKL